MHPQPCHKTCQASEGLGRTWTAAVTSLAAAAAAAAGGGGGGGAPPPPPPPPPQPRPRPRLARRRQRLRRRLPATPAAAAGSTAPWPGRARPVAAARRWGHPAPGRPARRARQRPAAPPPAAPHRRGRPPVARCPPAGARHASAPPASLASWAAGACMRAAPVCVQEPAAAPVCVQDPAAAVCAKAPTVRVAAHGLLLRAAPQLCCPPLATHRRRDSRRTQSQGSRSALKHDRHLCSTQLSPCVIISCADQHRALEHRGKTARTAPGGGPGKGAPGNRRCLSA